jgi:hypothetical protein
MEHPVRPKDLAILGSFAMIVAATRWPFAPKYLFYFDSVNMALSLEDFDPRLHQPQPPGYPLYVGLCRLIRAMGFTVEDTFIVSGVVAGALAGWLLWRLGVEWGNERAGWMAAALFSFTPVFWFNSLTNQGRGFSAVASAGTAWLSLRASRPGSSIYWLAGAAFFLATMAGFRPVESVMLAPLLVWAAWKRRVGVGESALVLVSGALPAALWGAVLLHESGGLDSFLYMMADYARHEGIGSPGTTVRPWRALYKTAEFVGAIHLVTFLTWFWALFFVRPAIGGKSFFLAVWALPGFAFQIVGHAADPCHMLATVTVFCWLGGLTIARLPQRAGVASLALACALGCALFAHPLRGAARPTSYNVIRRVNTEVSEAIDTIRAQQPEGPFKVLIGSTPVTWRHIAYYFPMSDLWLRTPKGPMRPNGPSSPLPPPDAPTFLLDRDEVKFFRRWDEALDR